MRLYVGLPHPHGSACSALVIDSRKWKDELSSFITATDWLVLYSLGGFYRSVVQTWVISESVNTAKAQLPTNARIFIVKFARLLMNCMNVYRFSYASILISQLQTWHSVCVTTTPLIRRCLLYLHNVPSMEIPCQPYHGCSTQHCKCILWLSSAAIFTSKPNVCSWCCSLPSKEQDTGPFYSTNGGVLNLSKATRRDSGNYTCIGTNSFGSVSESTRIIINTGQKGTYNESAPSPLVWGCVCHNILMPLLRAWCIYGSR